MLLRTSLSVLYNHELKWMRLQNFIYIADVIQYIGITFCIDRNRIGIKESIVENQKKKMISP